MNKNSALLPQSSHYPKRIRAVFYAVAALVAFLLFMAVGNKDSNWIILASGLVFLAGSFAAYRYMQKNSFTLLNPTNAIAILLIAGILLRLWLAVGHLGYKSDIGCWVGWSQSAYSQGLDHFYTSGQYADYPPLYIYVLYLLGAIADFFKITGSILLVKMPAIVCDCITALLVYSMASKQLGAQPGLSAPGKSADKVIPILAFACIILNPAIMINSSAWGQIDIIYTLMAVLCIYLLMQKKIGFAIVLFVLALLLKVQSVLLAPVILYVIIDGIRNRDTRRNTLVQMFAGAAIAIGLGLLLIMPFGGGRPITWIFNQYGYGVNLIVYQYITVNGFNLYGLFGLNWVSMKETFLGQPYLLWGIIGELSVLAYSAWLFIMNHKGKNLFNILAFIVLGVYMFSNGMHDRYSFAAPVLLLFSWCFMRDKRIFYAAIITFAVVLANHCVALQYEGGRWIPYQIVAVVSLANLLAFAYTAVVITKIAMQNKSIGKVGKENE